MCSCPEYKVDDFVTEILGVADARRFLDFFQFVVEGRAVENFSGIRITIFFILYPVIGIGDITIENVLSVFRVGFQIGRLDFLANELRILGCQIALEDRDIFFGCFGRKLLFLYLFFQYVQEMNRICGDFAVIIVKYP